jgi:hypothetical protein
MGSLEYHVKMRHWSIDINYVILNITEEYWPRQKLLGALLFELMQKFHSTTSSTGYRSICKLFLYLTLLTGLAILTLQHKQDYIQIPLNGFNHKEWKQGSTKDKTRRVIAV